MKRAGSQGKCALIRVRGLWCCALFYAPSEQDRRLVTEPVNDTKLASLSVIEQEREIQYASKKRQRQRFLG